MALIHLTILAAFMSTAFAQIQFPGNCSNQAVVDPFDVAQYLGKWYEIESYFQVFSAGAICVKANYSDNGNGTVKVYNTQFNGLTGQFSSITGSARQVEGTSGKLGVTFPVSAGEAPYWVLDTDYTQYSIVWACRQYANVNFQTVWFLSRTQNPSQSLRDSVRSKLEARGISTDDLNQTKQDDCPADPTEQY